jgi:hypothetical protein
MMEKLGWRPGTGLGSRGQGRSEPVEEGPKGRGREGLGYRRTRQKARKASQIKAAIHGTIPVFGITHENTFEKIELTTKGRPKPTGMLIAIHQHELKDPLWWGDGIVGIKERMFPHPTEWRLGDISKPLDKIEIKDLTRTLTEGIAKAPNCLAAWDKRIEGIDHRMLLVRYKPGLITPKDFGSHFKLILHRALLTNPHNPNASDGRCRMCKGDRESITHFGECVILKPIFKLMRKFDGGEAWDDIRLNLFGVNDMKGIIPQGTSALHFMLWKHALIQITLCSLKGLKVNAEDIIDKAVLRLQKRIKTLEYGIRCAYCKGDARATEVKLDTLRKRLEGIGDIDEKGKVTLHEDLQIAIEMAEIQRTP